MNAKSKYGLVLCAALASVAGCGERENVAPPAVSQKIQPTATLSEGDFETSYAPRVFEYTPKGDPSKLCVITVVGTKSSGISCFARQNPAP